MGAKAVEAGMQAKKERGNEREKASWLEGESSTLILKGGDYKRAGWVMGKAVRGRESYGSMHVASWTLEMKSSRRAN
jgi:hypothetical protein